MSNNLFLHQNGMDELSIKALAWQNNYNKGMMGYWKVPDKEFKRIYNVGREKWPYSRRHIDKYVVKDRGCYRFTTLGKQVLKESGYEV